MPNHYKTLGVTNASSEREIQRAYRTLARRYHPDVNPDGDTEATFQKIAEAYAILSDKEKRREYDLKLHNAHKTFEKSYEQAHRIYAQHAKARKPVPPKQTQSRNYKYLVMTLAPRMKQRVRESIKSVKKLRHRFTRTAKRSVSIVELSISVFEALYGTKKAVNLSSGAEKPRKVSVSISAGARSGTMIRFRNPKDHQEEIVIIVTVESHPWISLSERGVNFEIPISIKEAVYGSKILVPTLQEPVRVTIEPDTHSGTEVRLRSQGLTKRSGEKGDLYLRYIIQLPPIIDENSPDIAVSTLEDDYGDELRSALQFPGEYR